jgi:L-seryl-tRNA(Ser) seleniumtransferase
MRSLPQVDLIVVELRERAPHALVVHAARCAIDLYRTEISNGSPAPSFDEVVERAEQLLDARRRTDLQPVINATGVLIHTNLGRVPLGKRQLEAVTEIARGYSNLEYDLEAGRRGSRYSHASALISTLTGAEAALVVNNNAAAVLLTLAALGTNKEVIISRGELIEIGGEFRMPAVMSMSGTRLVEVGTTNRTHLADYERAIGAETGAILKVHPSNYKVVGFTSEVPTRDLAELARGRGLPFVYDAGSGFIDDGRPASLAPGEPSINQALAEGVDLITFSGDKLLGGPQAGVIAGRSDLLGRVAKHPLLRALRVDKMTLAALEATLIAHLEGSAEELPLWSLAGVSGEELHARARHLAATLSTDDLKAEAIASQAVTGGGSLPGRAFTSWAVALNHAEINADQLQELLRGAAIPVVGRIVDDRLLLDLRSVFPEQVDVLVDLVREALAQKP